SCYSLTIEQWQKKISLKFRLIGCATDRVTPTTEEKVSNKSKLSLKFLGLGESAPSSQVRTSTRRKEK
ncbi:MAG: hypothetical protein RIG63_26245, partial [Coleofasciculus chthonoplastes F3-SA18-01]|uniref:hypothetical protein n=1 Tax=Coleofasciculus chthonoplastes TaxID=64178 RepID=UPI0032F828E1